MEDELPLELVKQAAADAALDCVSVLTAGRAAEKISRNIPYLHDWQQAGHAGEMSYMTRSTDLFSNLEHFLPGVRSVLSFRLNYAPEELSQRTYFDCPEGHGRIARYAWGRDYHKVFPKLLRHFTEALQQRIGRQFRYRVFSDAVPLLERSLAADRLGFVGKNSMLISPGSGSYFFLGEVLLDTAVKAEVRAPVKAKGCGSCSRCKTACPTGAIVADKTIDSRRCISYLSIEKKGPLNDWEARALGDWLFGCDICQEVCPFNRSLKAEVLGDVSTLFHAPRASGPFLELSSLLDISDHKTFVERFAGSPLMRAGRAGLLRNACCVVANSRQLALVPKLINLAGDSEKSVRLQARWALKELLEFSSGSNERKIRLCLEGSGSRDVKIS